MEKATKKKTLAEFPDVAAQWHPTKSGDLTPDRVTAGSNEKFWWQCPEGPDHEWETVVSSRSAGTGCPFCQGKKVSATNSLAYLHPAFAAQWHPTKNGNVTPDKVVPGTDKKYWWQCPEGHGWEATPNHRTRPQGGDCPRCGIGWTLNAIRPIKVRNWGRWSSSSP